MQTNPEGQEPNPSIAHGRFGIPAASILLGGLLILGSPFGASANDTGRGGGQRVERSCAEGLTMASGRPDSSLFAREASAKVRAFWCERYDEEGRSTRTGPYLERYPSGRLRTKALYVDSRLQGPVEVYHESGAPFLHGFLDPSGEWQGEFILYHDGPRRGRNGKRVSNVWFEANFESGRLHGPVRTRFRDGALESESHYQRGREDGLSRSFYPTAFGGRLKSESHVEADVLVGRHRLLDPKGRLRGLIDWTKRAQRALVPKSDGQARRPASAQSPAAPPAGLPARSAR